MNDEDQFLPVYQKLYFNENVMYCDAVRGIFDIVLLLHGKSAAEMEEVTEKIRKMRGVDEVWFAAVEKPVLSDDFAKVISEMENFLMENNNSAGFRGMDACQCSAYAFLEIEPEAFESVYRHVYFMDNVVSCDTLNGPFKMALLLKAPTFMEIDEMVTGNIARINGVLRATQCNIIKLMEM
jgi:DNA-binding Lrp family transcriptional regulator